MRYVDSRLKEKQREIAYRIYVTDALKILTTNTARMAGGSELTVRYHDAVMNAEHPDDRSGDEVALDVILRAGLRLKQDEFI